MALFQSAVLKKYLQAQNKSLINEKWESYKSFFLDPAQQERINSLKEEQYQYGFLNDLFVKILGYTLEPNENFNLSTEYKNVKDSKKAEWEDYFLQEQQKAIATKNKINTTDAAIDAMVYALYGLTEEEIAIVESSN
uniref:hypothetical protein n=1 Tax=Flavobacterium sp. TaxID=239 RepID=UPI00404A447F